MSELVNIVAVAELNGPLDLKALSKLLPGTSFGAKSPWLKYNVEGGGYVAFYKSGKFLVTGVRTQSDVDKRAKEIMRLLDRAGISRKMSEVRVQNVVVMDAFALSRSLEFVQTALPHLDVTYEPEQFPGLMLKGKTATFLLFASGKCVCTGTKSPKIADAELGWLRDELQSVGCLK